MEDSELMKYMLETEKHILLNKLTAQEFVVYYNNLKELINDNKITNPSYYLETLYNATVVSMSMNSERLIYDLKQEIANLIEEYYINSNKKKLK